MCGIAGIVNWRGTPSADIVGLMTAALAHRGPDDCGVLALNNAALGHRRLSILDLSTRARQPMSSPDGRYHIVYNGEMYNFQSIKKELTANGVRFSTTSDTEVFLYSYITYGKACLQKFNGMFAAAIWDNKERTLFLARDRFGKKPLYYCRNSEHAISFASELTAFQHNPEVHLKYSLEAINCYLAIGYILSPMSIYQNIYKLKPAHYMLISNDGKSTENNCYWDYAESFRKHNHDTAADIKSNLLELLKDSVSMRMVSDVPVGAFLSGGVDSSSIVSLMRPHCRDGLHTFSMGFNLAGYSELTDAEYTAGYLHTCHHQEVCRADDANLLHRAVDSYDEPFSDSSLVPTFAVSQLAARHVKVVMSGDGADELFAGYITYKADQYRRFTGLIPRYIKQKLADLRVSYSEQKLDTRYKVRQFAYGALGTPDESHYAWRLIFRPEERVQLMGIKHRDLVYDTDPSKIFSKYYAQTEGFDRISTFLYVDGMTWLPDDILYKVDRASMHWGLEVRCPYLDYRIAEYAAGIPGKLKLNGLRTKYILKQALSGVLPKYTLRKKKSGFNAPVGSWIPNLREIDEHRAFNEYVYHRKVSENAV